MNSIITTTIQLWQQSRRTKTSSKGWISGNAPCCIHNGETADTKGRGGFIADDLKVTYSCFNCHFTANFTTGRNLTLKFRKLLGWIGADEGIIHRLQLEALRVKDIDQLPQSDVVLPTFKIRKMPDSYASFNEWGDIIEETPHWEIPPDLISAIHYTNERKIGTKYEFGWSPSAAHRLTKRVIVPCKFNQQVIGYTARAFGQTQPKYHNVYEGDFVFNLDEQQPHWKAVIVCEGPFDAMAIDGVAILGNDISDAQAELIESLCREVILVPDFDKAGIKTINRAIELNWSVSFPLWMDTHKDINSAVQEYGKLFVLQSIFNARQKTTLNINLRKKKLIHQLKGK